MTDQEWEDNKKCFVVTRTADVTRVQFFGVSGIVETADRITAYPDLEDYLVEDVVWHAADYIRDGIRRALENSK